MRPKLPVMKVTVSFMLESLFESISRTIESTVQICISEYSSLIWRLFDFGCEAMDLIKPCLYNKKAFDVVNMTTEVQYWIDAYKDRYSGKELVRECCQAIVFNLFCIIDGISSNNDFKIEKTVFDDTLYIDEALRKRANAAFRFRQYDDVVSKFIEQHNIDVNFEDYGGGVESIFDPYGSEKAVREAILAHEKN